jgi:hypothetical protein
MMAKLEGKFPSMRGVDVATKEEVIQHLKQAIFDGKHWYIALLESVRLWDSAEEMYNGRHYRYLIDAEAFDWLLLIERLCSEVDGLLPEEGKISLLFFAEPPIELAKDEFRELIGPIKYQAFLNYFYGVTIEEALILAVEEEICKEHSILAFGQENYIQQEAYRLIYGTDMITLLGRFRDEKSYSHKGFITLAEQKEFTYWLFKYRLKQSDKAKVASDTKKALVYFQRQREKHLARGNNSSSSKVISG